MASRYPLTIVSDTGGTLVGELPIGDTLNLTTSGIYDGNSSGGNGEVLKSTGGGVEWSRAADVYLDDEQTLKNKTLESCVLNASINAVTNISNASLRNSSIEINGVDISLGGSVTIPDTNDNTLYTISVVDGPQTSSKRIRLTASGSGSGTQDVFLQGDNYLSIGRTNSDTLNFNVSLSQLKTGSFLTKSTTNDYDGSTEVTIAVDATAGSSGTTNGGKVVSRNSSGNFYANKIFADLEGDVTGTADIANKLLISGANGNTEFTSYQVVITAVSNGNNSCYTDPGLVWDSSTNILGVAGGITTAGNLTAADIEADDITADKFIRTNGLSSQFLKADGSIDNKAYITADQAPNPIPSGTRMVFYQANAPTGWTKLTTTGLNDTVLRIVTGSGGGNYTSGSAFSTIFASSRATTGGSVSSHTLTKAQLASHNHTYTLNASASGLWMDVGPNPLFNAFGASANYMNYGSFTINNEGSGNSHDHGFTNPSINMNINYVDCIICSKD